MNETETRTWSSDEVRKLTGVTYRQLDHWCREGVFGDHHKDPGSGQRRRFGAHEIFYTAVLKRISDTLQELTQVERAGSTKLYADVVKALSGKRVDNVTTTRTELTLMPTDRAELYISMYDLRVQFSEEKLNAQE